MRRLEGAVKKNCPGCTFVFMVQVILSTEVATRPITSELSGSRLFIIIPVAIHKDPFQLIYINLGFEYMLISYTNLRGVHVMPSEDVIIG